MTTQETAGGQHPQSAFFVADWLVEPATLRIFRNGEEIRLEPKVMQVLVYLVGRAGEVVSREELEANVWAGRVVGYDAVANTIIKLRKAFSDNSRDPEIIETIPKTGYRLIAQVEQTDKELLQPSRKSASTSGRQRLIMPGVVAASLLLAAAAWFLYPAAERSTIRDQAADAVVVERPSIAVLPFLNVGSNPDQEYFADGLTEDLITDLSQIQGLDVVARNSIFAYKESGEHEQIIGRDLGVRYILKGAVQRSLNRLRLNVQLIRVMDSHTLWAQRYDRRLGDIFDIQDELAARIVSAMQVELAPADRHRLDRNYIASIESYDEFLKGLDYYGRRSPDDGLLAKAHYRKAIELDPGFARPYAGLALTYTRELTEGWGTSVDESLEQAYDLAQKALQLDPSIPQLYFAMSQVKLFQRDHRAAIAHIEKAITLNSSYADGYALMAWILHFSGQPQEGLGFMQRAMRLNPRTPAIYLLVLGSIHYALGNPSQAVELLQTGAEISPAFQRLRVWLAAAYAAAGEPERAAWEIDELLAINPSFTLKSVETTYPFLDPVYRDRFINDLRKAGIVE